MNSFRIVHLSDLHLTKDDEAARSQPNIFSALRGMNAAFRQLVTAPPVQSADLLVVTGDVTDRGDEGAWEVFWDAVDGAGLRARTLVIPGNHDVCCLGLRLPGKRVAYSEADLKRAQWGLRLGGQETTFPWARQVDARVVVFGVNSNNLGNQSLATNAMGEIGYAQLAKLARLLHTHREVPVKILLLHHSPNIPGDEAATRRALKAYSKLEILGHQVPQDQRRALRLLCIAHHVRVVLHGHLHRAEDRRVDGVRFVGTTASTEPVADRSGRKRLRIGTLTVHGDGGRMTRDHHFI